MKSALLVLALLVGLLAGCKNKEKTAKPELAEKRTTGVTAAQAAPPTESSDEVSGPNGENGAVEKRYQPHIADDLFFGMYTSPCFGQCPVFNLDINLNGEALLEGKRFFDYEGFFTTTISEGEMVRIIALANKFGYYGFAHVYDNPNVTDLPSVLTILRTETGVQWVYDRMGAPDALRSFEREMETLIKEWQWKPAAQNQD